MGFPKNFAKVLRTPILQNNDGWLLLKYFLKFKIATPDKLFALVGKTLRKSKNMVNNQYVT